jgi:Protein of unknown function (DUF559)
MAALWMAGTGQQRYLDAPAVVRVPLPPCIPQFDVVADGVFPGRADFARPEARVVVEYERAHHFEGVQIAKDDARPARLVAAGWRVIRVSAADFRGMDAIVRRAAAALIEGPVPA